MSGRLKINYFSDGLFIVLVFLCPPYFQASYKKGLEKFVLFLQRKASKWMVGLKR